MIVGISMQQASGVAHSPEGLNGDLNEATGKEVELEGNYGLENSQVTPQIHQPMNGGLPPPRQVYVSEVVGGMAPPGMESLENQFQSLGLQQEQVMAPEHPGNTNENGEDLGSEDIEGEEHEEDPVKLFVGQIPKALNEEDLFPTFDSFGPLKDIAVIRDKHTGLHRGCAFVTYWSGADADRAQGALHDMFTFPGARRPAQVKPAEPSVPENKLFIGMLSRKAGEAEVRELFAPFGEIREIYMIRNADGSSKCASFLRYVKREAAIEAIESLNNNLLMEGCARPLIVKFADNKHQRQQRQVRNVRRQEIMVNMGGPSYPTYSPQVPAAYAPQGPPQMAMSGHHPGVGPQYPLPPHQYGPATYGPGAQQVPQAAYGPGAQQVPQATYGPGAQQVPQATYGPGAQQVPQATYGPGPGAQHASQPLHPYMYPPYAYATPPQYASPSPARQEARQPNANPRPREGPAGANLFVYHLPHDLTDADLATAFNPFGNVISAKVYVDKYTGESKGFGFVSYDSVISAEAAIEQMNGFQIGNKRLKVQHKRVHGNTGSPGMGPQDPSVSSVSPTPP